MRAETLRIIPETLKPRINGSLGKSAVRFGEEKQGRGKPNDSVYGPCYSMKERNIIIPRLVLLASIEQEKTLYAEM